MRAAQQHCECLKFSEDSSIWPALPSQKASSFQLSLAICCSGGAQGRQHFTSAQHKKPPGWPHPAKATPVGSDSQLHMHGAALQVRSFSTTLWLMDTAKKPWESDLRECSERIKGSTVKTFWGFASTAGTFAGTSPTQAEKQIRGGSFWEGILPPELPTGGTTPGAATPPAEGQELQDDFVALQRVRLLQPQADTRWLRRL